MTNEINKNINKFAIHLAKILADLKKEIELLKSMVYKYRGSVSSFSELPEFPTVGDVYSVDTDGKDGENYVWTGDKWDNIAGASEDFVEIYQQSLNNE